MNKKSREHEARGEAGEERTRQRIRAEMETVTAR